MARPSALRSSAPETVRIAATSHDGRGIAAISGKKVFVPDVLEGEEVRILRRRRRRNYDEAELLEVLEASPGRCEPRCAVFGTCGGCAMQHVRPDEQRRIKEAALADSLARIGRVEPRRWLPPICDERESGSWGYRRRARLAVKLVDAKDRVLVGFRERHTPFVTDMRRCEILEPPLDGLVGPLSEVIGRLSIRRRLPQIEVAVADDDVELLMRVLDPPTDEDRAILAEFAAAHDLRIAFQTGGPGQIEPLDSAATPPLAYALPDFGLRLEFGAADFIQVNREVNRRLVSSVVELLRAAPGDRVLDLFCGLGNFSLALARGGSRVLGVEGDERLVRQARHNARRNGLDDCEFACADLAALTGREPWLGTPRDRLLLDPPRSGAAEFLPHVPAVAAARIVYVSCHPGTLARDAGVLVHEAGYRLEAAGIADMFPHTAHVESIAVFDKK